MELYTAWQSPSNIALIKYWGKYANQIPANPSISFTLSECHTQTELRLVDNKTTTDPFDFDVWLEGELKGDFKPKIQKFLKSIEGELGFLKDHKLEIKTSNSFPHSSGIASSASGMSALALGLLSLKEEITGIKEADFYQKASIWSRLGSGSASRSVYGGLVEWGKFKGLESSHNEYAVPYLGETHSVFKTFKDYVLLVEVGSKSVSSTAGHGLMNNHPYSESRFKQAHTNMTRLFDILKSGDLEDFGNLVESEALTLHAMMMTSNPYFILMKPNTVAVLDKIWAFRKETKLPLYFTLDAGANVHLLFPEEIEPSVKEFVIDSLTVYLKNGQYICDQVGLGPKKINT